MTTRTEPFMTWVAETFASSWPSAFRTGAAAAFAAASLSGVPPGAGFDSPGGGHALPLRQASPAGPPSYQEYVQAPGAFRATSRRGPEPSFSGRIVQTSPTSAGLPEMPSARASLVTSAEVTRPSGRWTAAEEGPWGSGPLAV